MVRKVRWKLCEKVHVKSDSRLGESFTERTAFRGGWPDPLGPQGLRPEWQWAPAKGSAEIKHIKSGKNCFKTMPPPKLKKQWTETLRLPVLRKEFGDPMDLLNKSKPYWLEWFNTPSLHHLD